jgi:hypothetical protein
MHINRLAPAALAVAGVLAAVTVAAEPARADGCRIQPLPASPLPGESAVSGGDPSGRYLIGARWTSPEESAPLMWVAGRLREFASPYERPTLVDVNAAGTVLGYESLGTRSHAWRYADGRFTALPGLTPTDDTWPLGLNERGDAVGTSSGAGVSRLVLWPAARPDAVRELTLADPAPGGFYAADIDDDATVVATATGATTRAFIWPRGGSGRPLSGPSGGLDVIALKIRNGWVGGMEITPDGDAPMAWRPGGGPVTRLDSVGTARAINRHGDLAVVGPVVGAAIAHRGGRLVPLPGTEPPSNASVATISDRGVAAGWHSDGTSIRPARWLGC